MAQWELSQIAQWVDDDTKSSIAVTGFRQDSRSVLPGDLFLAIRGKTVDGHNYLQAAAAQGAVGAIVSRDYAGPDYGLPLIRVANVIEALHTLARVVHAIRKMRVIGVTGSVAKTTLKEFIAMLLRGKMRVAKTPGNANSQIGVPLSLLNLNGDEEVVVVEMGMSLPGEIAKLVAIAPPEIAIITHIGLAHAVFFPEGQEGIARAKAEIFSHPTTRVGIIHEQVTRFAAVATGHCCKMTYGWGDGCNFLLCREKDRFFVQEQGIRTASFELPFSATHLAENFLGAAAVARVLGMQWPEIIAEACKLTPYMLRFERAERNGIVFINDSYNANPTSMCAALCNLPLPAAGKKRIGVLGSMKELGSYTEVSHREVACVALQTLDYLLCLGKEWQDIYDAFAHASQPVEHFLTMQQMKNRVYEIAEKGDVVLLKGSNSAELWRILDDSGD